jgi:hypothetical protein
MQVCSLIFVFFQRNDLDNGVVQIESTSNILGKYASGDDAELMELSCFLQEKKFTTIKETFRLHRDYPEAGNFSRYAGFLYIPLSKKEGYFVVFFRRERLKVDSRHQFKLTQLERDMGGRPDRKDPRSR